jgi:hypothetical protein
VKIIRLLVLVAFFGIFSTVALADSANDPVFKLGGGGGSEVLTSDSFSFTVNQSDAVNGFVSFDFINDTGALIQELDLLAPGGFVFSCDNAGDPYFNACSPTSPTPGPTTLSFFGVDETHPGIPTATEVFCPEESNNCTADVAASDFLITVGVSDMPVGSSFSVEGTLVPAAEPSTLLMVLAAGLGFLVVKRSGFAV